MALWTAHGVTHDVWACGTCLGGQSEIYYTSDCTATQCRCLGLSASCKGSRLYADVAHTTRVVHLLGVVHLLVFIYIVAVNLELTKFSV